jgi:hypothetical protein
MSGAVVAASATAGAHRDNGRLQVLWLGDVPPDLLTAACWQHGLGVRSVAREDIALVAPLARAIVLEVPSDDPEFAVWGSKIIAEALAHGLLVALVQYEQESELPQMEDAEAAAKFFVAVKSLRRDPSRARAFYRDWGRVAKWARNHAPGPGASADLVIDGAVSSEPAAELLLRRAFHDLRSVSLEVLSGGKSGASVWRVRPGEADRPRRPLPFVVKIHELEKMRAEQSNCFIVRNAVESRLYAPLDAERCVEGDELGLVVYDVVDRAMPFRLALPMSPDTLVSSLFGQTLNGFRACAAVGSGKLVTEFERGRLKALRWSDALREAAALARAMTPSVPDVEVLAAYLSSLPGIPFASATVHGDLHAGNLFVAANSSDVIMIDYGAVLQNAPAVADPACLEVSLAFPPSDESSNDHALHPSESWRRATYRYPLEPSAVRSMPGAHGWLPHAIRAIRAQARIVDPSAASYGIAVASYLIRFASFDDHAPVEVRALAYELACNLVSAVLGDLGASDDLAGRTE